MPSHPRLVRLINSAVAAVAVLGALPSTAADWPQYHGENHDRTTAEPVPTGPWPASGPVVRWKVPTDAGFSSFVVGGGRALTLVRDEVEGIEREVLLALDASSGDRLWSRVLGVARYGHDGGNSGAPGNDGGDGPRSTPAVDGDRVFVTDSDLHVSCFNAADGEPVWSRDILSDHDGTEIKWKNAASPVIDGDLLFLAGGGAGQALLALDKSTGATVWKTQDDTLTHATPVVATIHGQRQVIFFTRDGLVAVAPTDGRLLWRQEFPFNVSTAASPVVAGDLVYCSAGYGVGAGLYRVTRSGNGFATEEVWRTPNDNANHWSTPVLHEGHLYGMFSFKEYGTGPLACVELATGETKWKRPGFGPGNVILAGQTLIALTDAGEVVLVEPDPAGYKELARANALDGKCWSTPVFSGGTIFARSTKEAVALGLGAGLDTTGE